MTTKIIIPSIFALIAILQFAYGQSNEEKAYQMGMQAIKLMQDGEIKQSIKLLEKAGKLDPGRIDYPYEIALAYYIDKDYKKSIQLLQKLTKHKEVTDQVHQLLGNSYSMDGKRDKAIKAYENGLKIFPNSGILYLERGNMELIAGEYGSALSYYEQGIKVAPKFPSNYYWASKIYCSSTEAVWGMIYGEIFMNLERVSRRTDEISKLLFDTYNRLIQFNDDSSITVSFSKYNFINLDEITDHDNIKLPFGIGVYEPTLLISLLNEKSIDIHSLGRIRENFLDLYFKNGNNQEYPNILFDYHNKVFNAGHLQAYNYWVLIEGDEEGFKKWHSENADKWDSFVEWFTGNPFIVDENNNFHRELYE